MNQAHAKSTLNQDAGNVLGSPIGKVEPVTVSTLKTQSK